MTLQQCEERISNSLVSRAEEASKLRIRVIGLEQLLRMIRSASTDPAVHKLLDLADIQKELQQ